MQAAIAKRLATIAQGERRLQAGSAMQCLPAIGAVLIRAGKAGVSERTLCHAAGVRNDVARQALKRLEAGGFAHKWGALNDTWRLDTVQILAREERAALEALHAATTHEREAAAGAVAERKENAPSAQTGGKNGWR